MPLAAVAGVQPFCTTSVGPVLVELQVMVCQFGEVAVVLVQVATSVGPDFTGVQVVVVQPLDESAVTGVQVCTKAAAA